MRSKQIAYDEYDDFVTQRWRGGDAEGYSETSIGQVCTVQGADYPLDYGAPGHIKRVGGKIVCVPDAPRSRDDDDDSRERATSDARKKVKYDPHGRVLTTEVEEDDDDEDDYEESAEEAYANTSTHTETGRSDAASVQRQKSAHSARMEKIYDAMDRALESRWRDGK
jgi:hypothetical protein